MTDKLNFPVKYAALELKIQGNYYTNYEDITVGFIVSKCYVVNEKIKHYKTGISEKSYEVVFPYKDIYNFKNNSSGDYQHHKRQYADYNFNGECINSDTVSEVFNTYEEALELARKENYNNKKRLMLYVNSKEEYQKTLKKFQEDLIICQKYEQFIFEKTTDMIVADEVLTKTKRYFYIEPAYKLTQPQETSIYTVAIDDINALALFATTLKPQSKFNDVSGYIKALHHYYTTNKNQYFDCYQKIISNSYGEELLSSTIRIYLFEQEFRKNQINPDIINEYNSLIISYQQQLTSNNSIFNNNKTKTKVK